MGKRTLAIVGCGKLAQIIVDALNNGLLPDYKLIGTYSRTFEKAERLADYINRAETVHTCTASKSLDELFTLNPDYILETASPAAMRELAIPALEHGSSIVTLSIGAFADTDFYESVKEAARTHNTRVHLVPGAIGGFDVLRTVALMSKSSATFATEKGPNSLKNTEVYDEGLQNEKRTVLKGNAVEAIELFPTKVNVAVAAALASVGPEEIGVSITSTPDFVGDRHRIEMKNDQVDAIIDIYSRKSDIAGWSVVNTLRNITSPIAF
ncbi:aspartate dehydrogenase domain-containing protein [Pricia sp. S334]|uniref:L-aspartate dehydrogenase n=1 Tax=Pricia mediterranea TaxID=3076079 RepID=A0ABU3L0Z2_9FLAO|nr:aspartate dehydrogenase domain-containing protein [Pricia sp. S334]MDT7827366.1 aspartate dehydrogenase domain-containing protein [Pricia sp. S334]